MKVRTWKDGKYTMGKSKLLRFSKILVRSFPSLSKSRNKSKHEASI